MDTIHAFDQLRAALRDLAPVLYSYHSKLQKEGFSKKEVLQLVIELQRSLLTFKQ